MSAAARRRCGQFECGPPSPFQPGGQAGGRAGAGAGAQAAGRPVRHVDSSAGRRGPQAGRRRPARRPAPASLVGGPAAARGEGGGTCTSPPPRPMIVSHATHRAQHQPTPPAACSPAPRLPAVARPVWRCNCSHRDHTTPAHQPASCAALSPGGRGASRPAPRRWPRRPQTCSFFCAWLRWSFCCCLFSWACIRRFSRSWGASLLPPPPPPPAACARSHAAGRAAEQQLKAAAGRQPGHRPLHQAARVEQQPAWRTGPAPGALCNTQRNTQCTPKNEQECAALRRDVRTDQRAATATRARPRQRAH